MDFLNLTLIAYAGITTIPFVFFLKDHFKSKDAREIDLQFIRDLSTRGRTIIEIKRVNPEETFIRSPKDLL